MPGSSASSLTPSPAAARRIRLTLALLPIAAWAVLVWTTYAIDISPPGHLDRSGHIKGHDFVHYYVLGQIARDDAPADLYDYDALSRRTDAIVTEYPDRFLPVHGPQVALFFSPLARLPYLTALAIWLLCSGAVYAACVFTLWRLSPALKSYGWVVLIAAIGYPPFYMLIANGVTSALGLLLVTAAWIALRSSRPILAGLALGSLFYKPALGAALPLVFLLALEWRMILGAVAAVFFQLAAGWYAYGSSVMRAYVQNALRLGSQASLLEPHPFQMQSLRSFFDLLLPWPTVSLICYLGAAMVVIVMAARAWRSHGPLAIRFSVLLLAMILVDPHVNGYDLVIAAPVFVLSANTAIRAGTTSRSFQVIFYAAFFLPALDFIPIFTHVQVSVVALAALLTLLANMALKWCVDFGRKPITH